MKKPSFSVTLLSVFVVGCTSAPPSKPSPVEGPPAPAVAPEPKSRTLLQSIVHWSFPATLGAVVLSVAGKAIYQHFHDHGPCTVNCGTNEYSPGCTGQLVGCNGSGHRVDRINIQYTRPIGP